MGGVRSAAAAAAADGGGGGGGGDAALYAALRAARPFFLVAGPNVIESRSHLERVARHVKAVADRAGLELVFKASFDKANRTCASSFRGPGLEEGLAALEAVRTALDLRVLTDVHEPWQCEAAARVADVLQVPAFLCRQTDLLTAAAATGRVVNVKKGQWCDAAVMRGAVGKLRAAGNARAMVCERGTAFGYTDVVVDTRNLWRLRRECGVPVVADITHALQQPAARSVDASGGVASGGLRELIPTVGRACVAAGVDGVFMEMHDDPRAAPCDGPTQWPLRAALPLLEELKAIATASRAREEDAPIDLTPVDDEWLP